MKERPILFSGAMVRAILEGRKTQTRRVVKLTKWVEPHDTIIGAENGQFRVVQQIKESGAIVRDAQITCLHGMPGERLWVRETWADVTGAFQTHDCEEPKVIAFRADDAVYNTATMHFLEHRNDSGIAVHNWKPSIFLPRYFSRITLEITNVRLERLQEISEADIRAEGIDESTIAALADDRKAHREPSLLEAWCVGWDSLNAKRGYSWESNPWVWAIEFKRLEVKIEAAEAAV